MGKPRIGGSGSLRSYLAKNFYPKTPLEVAEGDRD